MSSTWSFTVTYKSGDTVDVESSNRYIVIPNFNCNATEDTGTVTVSFKEPLPNGASQSKSVDVTYTLTGEKAVPDMAILSAGDYFFYFVNDKIKHETFKRLTAVLFACPNLISTSFKV